MSNIVLRNNAAITRLRKGTDVHAEGITELMYNPSYPTLAMAKEALAEGRYNVPTIEHIHSRVYEAASRPGALDMGNWHCGDAHCRAGWVVELAGEAGRKLEEEVGSTGLAAAMIYIKSDPLLDHMPVFLGGENPRALADMKRLADGEQAREKVLVGRKQEEREEEDALVKR
jgi:hypothetical protein